MVSNKFDRGPLGEPKKLAAGVAVQRVWIVVLVALLVYLTYQVFAPFIAPLAWAGVLTILFYRAHADILRRLKRPNLAALATTLLITLVLIVPALLVGTAFAKQAVEAATELQAKWGQGQLALDQIWETPVVKTASQWLGNLGVTENQMREWTRNNIQSGAQLIATFLATRMGRWAKNVLMFLFNLFVTLFATFYLLRDGPQLLVRVRDVLPISESRREGLLYIAYNVLYASVMSSFVVAAVQGALGGILFWILGIDKPLLWGVVMGFLSLLPLLGAWLVWIPAGLSLMYSGDYLKAVILITVGATIIGTVDNFLRPMLISGRSQLNGLLIFISILGGVAAFGMLGIVLGPVLVALGDAVLEFFANPVKTGAEPAEASSDS